MEGCNSQDDIAAVAWSRLDPQANLQGLQEKGTTKSHAAQIVKVFNACGVWSYHQQIMGKTGTIGTAFDHCDLRTK